MKTTNLIWLIILLAITAFGGCKQTVTQEDDFITVDVTAKYPHKKLFLQDFMDVEYIPLETTDEFVCQGITRAVGKEIIIVTNQNNDDGNIFIFNRNGKALKKINHKGQGGEEYTSISRLILDEENGEILINSGYAKKILVYDLEGNFKRRLSVKEDLLLFNMYNFNRDNLICHDATNENSTRIINTGQSFMLISKQDGSISKEIQIPFKEKKSIVTSFKDETSGMYHAFLPSTIYPIVPYFNDFILLEHSADTLYRYSPDQTMKPFIVRTPSIQSMNPDGYLFLSMFTDRYYFMETFIKGSGYQDDLIYDKQEKALFRYKVYNNDYTNNKEAFLKSTPLNGEIPSCQYLEASELVQEYERGRLKGKLKEIASKLDTEDNPVIMLIKHKK